ncbi:MAG: folBK [Mycetocola sp.]|nr:folBK [Mycetocola sp.]
MSPDRIRLQGLRVHGRHGVFPAERELGQQFIVDLELVVGLAAAAASDDVADTVHYGELAQQVAEIVAGEPVYLIERLADRIAQAVLERPLVEAVTVTVHKPQAPIPLAFGDVSVTVTRAARTAGCADSRSGADLGSDVDVDGRPVQAVLALGSNLGDREGTLRSAVGALRAAPGVHVTAVSPALETAAVTLDGVNEDKPAYLNQVVLATTALPPAELLATLLEIEQRHGRVRAERWGDRTLDLDVIAYGDRVVDTPDLQVPHPRAAERAFVLRPWLAVDPDAVLPGAGRVDALLAALPATRPEALPEDHG